MGQFDYMKDKTDEELVDLVEGADLDTPAAAHVARLLQVRNGQRQVEASKGLVRATWFLGAATFLRFSRRWPKFTLPCTRSRDLRFASGFRPAGVDTLDAVHRGCYWLAKTLVLVRHPHVGPSCDPGPRLLF